MTMTDNDFVRHFQYRAQLHGHYKGKIDGAPGPMTIGALDAVLPAKTGNPMPVLVTNPAVSPIRVLMGMRPLPEDIPAAGDAKLEGVHPELADLVRDASAELEAPFTVIEGVRTMERQRKLFAAGASRTLNSRHLTGHAVDLWPLDAATGRPLASGTAEREEVLWTRLREIAKVVKRLAEERSVPIEWGGDWGWDAPHFQLSRKAYPA